MKNILRAVILVAFCASMSNIYAQPGCPAVSTAPSVIIPCGQTCATLNATAFSGAQTTAYTASPITYSPPFAFNVGTSILVATDDIWSDVIPLPFNFCFYGNVYNNILVGSNGVISFNTGNANGFNSWSITGALPANAPADLFNSIMGPWQDMDPTNAGTIKYQIGGAFPCRYFEVSWDACPMYGDPNSVNTAYCSTPLSQSQQIVIYETTNAIEVYLENKQVICNDLNGTYWNGGLAVEGIIDAGGTPATVIIPGRNATQWTATSDAYRFTPSGPANYTIAWLANNGTQIGTGPSIVVCPPDTGTYTAVATYTNCDNSTVVVQSTIFVGIGTLHTRIDSVHQPNCHNDSTGAVYASFTSSTPVTSYGWSPGGAGQLSLTNIPAGTYIFHATDSTGCTKADTVTLINPPPIVVTVSDTTIVSCTLSTNSGALIAQVSGGTPAYSYNWSNNLHTDTITGLPTGTYTVTVTDAKSCKGIGTGHVSVSIYSISFAPPVITNTTCSGGNNGKIVVNVTGAAPPVSYNWSGTVSSTDSAMNLAAGTYTVTATDSLGCSVSAAYTVGQPSHINVDSATITLVTCSAGGGVVVVDTGGTGTLTYVWSTGTIGDTLRNVSAGTYILVVTDQNGCTDTSSFTVGTAPGGLIFAPPIITNVRCNGDANGSITVSASGGVPPMLYRWNTGDTTATITGLSAGTYTVTASDSLECVAIQSYTVTQPNVVALISDSITNVSCNGGSNGCIVVSAGGGTGTIIYNWSNGDTLATNCGLIAGTYTLTITDSVGCSATDSFTVTQPTPIIIDSTTTTQATCVTGGSIIVTASGGTGTLVYTWSNTLTGDTLTNLAGGPITVTITDQNGCSISATDTITAAPNVVVFGTPVITNVTCHGDTSGCITATSSGGTGPVVFHWSNGDSTATICSLGAGSYSVTITDSVGCSASTTYNVLQPNAVTFNPPVIVNVSCNGGNNGCITISATGGTGVIVYHWSTGDSTTTICGLAVGPYTVTATDSLGCSASAVYNVGQPNPITFNNPIFTLIRCFGDSTGGIIASASGGTAPYHYSWSINNDSTAGISGLTAGSYTVTATDSLGCSASFTYTLSQPLPITIVAVTVTPVTCAAGGCIIIVGATGGTGTLVYSWSNGLNGDSICGLSAGAYTYTITDQNGCSLTGSDTVGTTPGAVSFGPVTIVNELCNGGSTGSITASGVGGTGTIHYHWSYQNATTATISGLIAGTYNVTITDSVGCSASTSYTVTQPTPIVIDTVSIIQATCQTGGCIVVSATGGTPGYTYLWSNGATGDSICNVPVGAISVSVTDQNGCTASAAFTITTRSITIDTVSTTPATCQAGGCIVVTTLNGTGTVTYHWSNNATGDSLCNLSGGPISVTATDQIGCTASATFTIPTAPGVISFGNAVVDSATCNGSSTGSISVTTTGGTGTISYHWNYQNDSTATISNLPAGTYIVTASDANGCSASTTYFVGEPPALNATISYTQELCFNANDGNATVTATGGTPGYTYRWNNNTTNASDTGLSAGTVTVTVTDSKGCTVTSSATINQRTQLNSTVISHDHHCQANNYSSADIIPTGGVAPITITVAGFGTEVVTEIGTDTSAFYDSLPPGQYQVTLTDSAGCTSSNIIVVQASLSDVITHTQDSATCNGATDGELIITPHDLQNGPFAYSLNGGAFQSDSIFSNLAAGVYTVVVNNAYGCSSSYQDTVYQPAPGSVMPNPDTVETTVQTATPIVLTVSNFTNPVYSWSPADGLSCTNCASPSATVTGPTTYVVTVSDSLNNKCAVVDTVVVLVEGLFHMPNAFTPNGDGKNDEFGPISFSYATVKSFRIYNRWGQCIHNSTQLWDGKFDGKDQPAGTYLYYIEADHYDQYDYTKVITEKLEGTVTLLR